MPRNATWYPASRKAAAGKSLSGTLVSCRQSTSGLFAASQSMTSGSRRGTEVMVHVAILIVHLEWWRVGIDLRSRSWPFGNIGFGVRIGKVTAGAACVEIHVVQSRGTFGLDKSLWLRHRHCDWRARRIRPLFKLATMLHVAPSDIVKRTENLLAEERRQARKETTISAKAR